MSTRAFAYVIFIFILVAVFVNTAMLQKQIGDVISDVEELNLDEGDSAAVTKAARELYKDFKKKESFISLTVSHDDLTNIESSFSELIGYLSVGEFASAVATKNRLLDSLEHLRRLSDINLEAII